MALRQMYTAETMFIDDGLTDGAMFPPSSNAVYDALQNAIELPSVTAEDDGDVLTVVSGAWAKATPSGGGGVFAIGLSDAHTLDKTWKEIHDAGSDGEFPFVLFINDGEIRIGLVMCVYEEDGSYCVDIVFDIYDGKIPFSAETENGYPTSASDDGGGGGGGDVPT